MRSTAVTAKTEDNGTPEVSNKLMAKIGSIGFKWALKGILAVLGTALSVGMLYLVARAASYNPDVMAAKSDVDALKRDYSALKTTSDEHTVQLSQAVLDRAKSDEVQGKIFEAIKKLGDDVHNVDLHVAKVDQKVDDLKDQRKTP